jgi:ABC-type polysaccharide/polyol phosphate transport system ATPase subunit
MSKAHHVDLRNVFIEFPIYGGASRSLKKAAVQAAVGGLLGRDKDKGSISTVRALSDITFSLREGDRLALVGHNGAGKTTLLRVMAGIYRPIRGHISISGRRVPLFDIGVGLSEEATGYENIFLRGILLGLSRKEIEERVDSIAAFSGLGDYLDLPVRIYSSGMLLRLMFSIATSTDPEILLMDEWLSAGDAAFVEKANQRMASLVDRAGILVLASHDPSLLRRVCNRAVLVQAGSIVEQGSVDDVLAAYAAGTTAVPIESAR